MTTFRFTREAQRLVDVYRLEPDNDLEALRTKRLTRESLFAERLKLDPESTYGFLDYVNALADLHTRAVTSWAKLREAIGVVKGLPADALEDSTGLELPLVEVNSEEFLRLLSLLTMATGYEISGCGCCGSPRVDLEVKRPGRYELRDHLVWNDDGPTKAEKDTLAEWAESICTRCGALSGVVNGVCRECGAKVKEMGDEQKTTE